MHVEMKMVRVNVEDESGFKISSSKEFNKTLLRLCKNAKIFWFRISTLLLLP